MLARTSSSVLHGVEAISVAVEVYLGNGLPAFTVVGLPDATVSEARDRVRGAITHSGFEYPMCRITANLAPSDVRKHGSGLDLALALCILVALEKAPHRGLGGRAFIGELGLAGDVRPVRGALSGAEAARRAGLKEVICPAPNAAEAALAGIPAIGVHTLKEAIDVVRGVDIPATIADADVHLSKPFTSGIDLAQIRDQDLAKRALEVAAAGGHNIVFSGPPGSGKTLLARALPGILPRLTLTEALEVTRIHSAAGLLPPGESLVSSRPFRAPHHGVSMAGVVGGGSQWVRPGEATLAHRGVLFMDEFPEFPRSVLESLRQPLEDGVISITRSKQSTTFPARFMLAAAMNPCPCGNRGTDKPCKCPPRTLEIYKQRLSGPLMDRIDMHVEVGRVEATELLRADLGETSKDVMARVEAARASATDRFETFGVTCNGELASGPLLNACLLDEGAGAVLIRAGNRHRLSARSMHRILRVARTIADLEGTERVSRTQILEAITYRLADRHEGP